MDTLSLQQERAVTRLMQKWEACEMCAFRFCGRQSFDRRYLSNTEQAAVTTSAAAAAAPSNPSEKGAEKCCPLCFGLLEQFSSDDFVAEVKKHFNEKQYEVVDFQLAVSLPSCGQLRDHAFWLHLLKQLERDSFEDPDSLSALSMLLNEDRQDFIVPFKYAWRIAISRKVEEAIGAEAAQNSPFVIQLSIFYRKSDEECRFLELLHPAIFRKQRACGNSASNSREDCSYLSRNCVQEALKSTHEADIFEQFETPPKRVEYSTLRHEIGMSHEPIAFGGRYVKLSRFLSQTPWLVDGERRCISSVEELICDQLRTAARASAYRFSAAGREDCDVRMLGDGRPFAVQLIDPHRTRFDAATYRALEQSINEAPANRQPADSPDSPAENLITVRLLCPVTRTALNTLNDGGVDDRRKTYSALIASNRPLDEAKVRACVAGFKFPIRVAQPTPIRVLHRRAVATRQRDVFTLRIVDWLDDCAFRIELETQAGAYVKEFVHGDLGRTRPCLTELLRDCTKTADVTSNSSDSESAAKQRKVESISDGAPAAEPFELDCAELDVLGVDFQWPPGRSDGK